MYLNTLFRHLRTLIVMLMTVAFVVAPMSAAADSMHACDENTITCSDTGPPQDGSDEEPSHDGHEHTVHHCGGCHIHLIGGGIISTSAQPTDQTKQLRPGQTAYVSLSLDGLYRPPRA